MNEPADGQEQEQRERGEQGEAGLAQGQSGDRVGERVADGEHRVLEHGQAGDAQPRETDRRPHEPRVERRLAGLVAPREGLAEDRLPRVVDVEDGRDPHPERGMPDRVGGKEDGEDLCSGSQPTPLPLDRSALRRDRDGPEHAPVSGTTALAARLSSRCGIGAAKVA